MHPLGPYCVHWHAIRDRDRAIDRALGTFARDVQKAAEESADDPELGERGRARIASLKAADQTFASAVAGSPTPGSNGDLSRMTIREAILAVLTEAKPEPVRTRDLDRILTERGKKVQGGVSVDLTTLKQAGEVLNPRWGFWTVP